MSTSDLYRVYRTTARHVAEFRNGWGTAPLLWDHLADRFIAKGAGWWSYSDPKDRRLWGLAKDERVPRPLRLVHAFTFDKAFCPADRVTELADACDVVAVSCAKDQHVNHWSAVAAELRKAKTRAKQLGWGLSCTSVEDPWINWKGDPEPWNVYELIEPALAGQP